MRIVINVVKGYWYFLLVICVIIDDHYELWLLWLLAIIVVDEDSCYYLFCSRFGDDLFRMLDDFGRLHRGTEESFPELLQEVLLDSANVWAYGIYS